MRCSIRKSLDLIGRCARDVHVLSLERAGNRHFGHFRYFDKKSLTARLFSFSGSSLFASPLFLQATPISIPCDFVRS